MKFASVLLIFAIITRWSLGNPTVESSANLRLLREIGKSVNFSANPCSDPYEYFCGNYNMYSLEKRINQIAQKEIGQYLKNTSMADKPTFVKNAHAFYSSCLKADRTFHLNTFVQWLRDHENYKWALFEESAYDWTHTLGLMRRYGLRYAFIESIPFLEDSSSQKIGISVDRPWFAFGMFEEDIEFADWNLQSVLGGQVWDQISDLYNDLDDLIESYEEKDEEEIYAVKDLKFTWLKKYISAMWNTNASDVDMKIAIRNVPYVEALDVLLKKHDNRTICRYLELNFFKNMYNTIKYSHEGNQCELTVSALLPEATQWIYEQLHPDLEQTFPKVRDLFKEIKTNVETSLKSKDTEMFRLTNLKTMELEFGNMPRVETVNNLEAFYANLNLNNADYFGNLLKVLNFNFQAGQVNVKKEFGFIHQFESYILGRNGRPYNDAASNVIVLPAVYLRPPYYHADYSDIFKYSLLYRLLSYYIYGGLSVKGLKDTDTESYARYDSVRIIHQMLFSSPVADADATYSINGENVSSKELFFLNAGRYSCKAFGSYGLVTKTFKALPEFKETFGCQELF